MGKPSTAIFPASNPLDMQVAFEALRSVAKAVSPALLAEIERIGPIELAPPDDGSVADQLYPAIVGQQLSVKAADTIWARILAAAKEEDIPLHDLFAPGYEASLRICGVSRNKIRALQAVRVAEAEGLLDRDALALIPAAERTKRLTSIWGVGRWTADMLGIFYFLDPDIWPDGDVAAAGMLRRITGMTNTIETAAPFAPYRSLLACYLWRCRDVKPIPAA